MLSEEAPPSNVVVDDPTKGGGDYAVDVDDSGYLVEDDGSAHDVTQNYEEDENDISGDGYGGMPSYIYDAIVDYKKNGNYPDFSDQRLDRSAHCHWRMRCQRFILSSDGATLLYYNQSSTVNDQPKVVVKKGEAKYVLERIHDLIGHLGMKRTQMAVLKKLYWRSVRNDVRNYINTCDFCVRKKVEGRKLIKAPVDITSDDFDINVDINPPGAPHRLTFSLRGIDEEIVRSAATARMTTYTFKETAEGNRSRVRGNYLPSAYKRQPYVKRSRYGVPAGFLLPCSQLGEDMKTGPAFIELPDHKQLMEHDGYVDHEIAGEEIVMSSSTSRRSGGQSVGSKVRFDQTAAKREAEIEAARSGIVPRQRHTFAPRFRLSHGGYLPDDAEYIPEIREHRRGHSSGAAQRFVNVLREASADRILEGVPEDVITSAEDARTRPEQIGLPPVLLMPSTDPDVVAMQKELLERQANIQLLQEKTLQLQLEMLQAKQATRWAENGGERAEWTHGDQRAEGTEQVVVQEHEELDVDVVEEDRATVSQLSPSKGGRPVRTVRSAKWRKE